MPIQTLIPVLSYRLLNPEDIDTDDVSYLAFLSAWVDCSDCVREQVDAKLIATARAFNRKAQVRFPEYAYRVFFADPKDGEDIHTFVPELHREDGPESYTKSPAGVEAVNHALHCYSHSGTFVYKVRVPADAWLFSIPDTYDIFKSITSKAPKDQILGDLTCREIVAYYQPFKEYLRQEEIIAVPDTLARAFASKQYKLVAHNKNNGGERLTWL